MLEEVLPFFHYRHVNRRFSTIAADAEQAPVAAAEYEKLSEDVLDLQLKEERQRAAAIDEKTFKLTLSVTFALTIIGTVSASLLGGLQSRPLQFLIGCLLGLVVFYALAAGFVALGAMRTLPSYGLGAYPEFKDKPGARREFLASSLARNEKLSIVRHARNETAYTALRNSFLCLFVALGLYSAAIALPFVKSARSWLQPHATAPMTPASTPVARQPR